MRMSNFLRSLDLNSLIMEWRFIIFSVLFNIYIIVIYHFCCLFSSIISLTLIVEQCRCPIAFFTCLSSFISLLSSLIHSWTSGDALLFFGHTKTVNNMYLDIYIYFNRRGFPKFVCCFAEPKRSDYCSCIFICQPHQNNKICSSSHMHHFHRHVLTFSWWQVFLFFTLH